ncbi:MAG: beta-1,6-N-acetylglucosaminyltransferase [Bacteroidales bacterium]|nr:beta-1,6-N-acetylglucosaminyltransferase [Bacteroidales bacterium]
MRNAYLILAHNEFSILRKLVDTLDDSRNDIFIHFDKKIGSVPILRTFNAGLYILEDRVDVRWGDLSVVEGEYKLFEAATSKGQYDYYHLLSGVDLPIKSQDYINGFLEENSGKQFIGYTLTEITPEVVRKVQRYHLFPEDFKNKRFLKRVLRAGFIKAQEIVGYKRNREVNFKKGSQWVSLTDGFVRYVIEKKDWVMKTFRSTFCADEIFVQTLCWNSPFRETIYDTKSDARGCMRCIGWEDGELHPWMSEDYDRLASSEALFARKFSSAADKEIIDKVVETLAK